MAPTPLEIESPIAKARKLADTQAEDYDPYWNAIDELHQNPRESVFEAARTLAISSLVVERQLAADILGKLGRPLLPFRTRSGPTILALLGDDHSRVVESAVHAMGCLRIDGWLDSLSPLLDHESPDVRLAIAMGVSCAEGPRTIAMLARLSADSDASVRDWSTFSIGQNSEEDSPEIRELLIARLEDPHDETRGEALLGLALRKDPRVLGPLLQELQSDCVQRLAIEAACQLKDPQLRPALQDITCWCDASEDLLREATLACSEE